MIHVHHPHSLADVAVLIRAGRTPVVVTQHADQRRGAYRPVSRLVLRLASAIVVPSRAHVAMSRELQGFEPKVEVIPFGIDESRWSAVPAPPEDGPVRALFIGRLVVYKGLDILIRALPDVPDLALDIVGSGPEGPRLRTLAQALAVSDRIHLQVSGNSEIEAAVRGYQGWIADEVLARQITVGSEAPGESHAAPTVDLDGLTVRVAITRVE